MQGFFEFLVIMCCAVFAGAAIYINLVEHPARMTCDIRAAWQQWQASYQRAVSMQAPLALAGLVFAVLAWLFGASGWVLIGGLLLGAVVPFTLKVIMPVNDELKSLTGEQAEAQAEPLLRRWNELHQVRSGLSLLALIILVAQA
ncbi:MAG: DUF1772 domain-containing protein [Pseudomonadota bacterium]|nr:hypothetical protein [Pseudomonadales bacterium]MDY6921184.1 DUF1772 domain-containing protein [Pseudomonadota bacterium]